MKQNYLITLPHEYKEPNHMVSVIGKPGLCGPKPRPLLLLKCKKIYGKSLPRKTRFLNLETNSEKQNNKEERYEQFPEFPSGVSFNNSLYIFKK